MPIYLVERDLPGLTRDQFIAAQRAAVQAAARAAANGVPVRYLRGLFVPSEGRSVCVFEGPDAESVRAVNLAAGVPLTHVVEVLEFPAA
jgi:Protein of unknown function (DUF4242)